jgi:hypothetical protein
MSPAGLGGQAAHSRRGAAAGGELRQAAGATATQQIAKFFWVNGGPFILARRSVAMARLAPRTRSDWTDEELNEIERLKKACGEIDHLELECSHTDEGDPWCIIYDHERDRIMLHIARIDRRYVAVFPMRARSEWSTALQTAIDLALDEVMLIGVSTSKVSDHPPGAA